VNPIESVFALPEIGDEFAQARPKLIRVVEVRREFWCRVRPDARARLKHEIGLRDRLWRSFCALLVLDGRASAHLGLNAFQAGPR
jgi:hypothetical protein